MTVIYQVIAPIADVCGQPDAKALRGKIESQLSMGETFIAQEDLGDWVRGACAHDDYPGFVEKRYLTKAFTAATHIVIVQRSHIYSQETMKSPIRTAVGLGARVSIVREGDVFAELATGGFIPRCHLSPLTARADFVAVAERFIGTPYVWAGRSGLGIDCSGLVQVALSCAGHTVMRDCDQQENTIGHDVTDQPRQRGDLVYFKGHVGIMVNDRDLLNADAHHMAVVVEDLQAIITRRGAVTGVRRIS